MATFNERLFVYCNEKKIRMPRGWVPSAIGKKVAEIFRRERNVTRIPLKEVTQTFMANDYPEDFCGRIDEIIAEELPEMNSRFIQSMQQPSKPTIAGGPVQEEKKHPVLTGPLPCQDPNNKLPTVTDSKPIVPKIRKRIPVKK